MPVDSDISRLLADGERLFSRGETDSARATFEEVLRLEPRSVDARNNLAVIACARRQFDTAESLLLDALQLDPDAVDAHVNYCSLAGKAFNLAPPKPHRPARLLASLKWISDNAADPSRAELLAENHRLRESVLARFRDKYAGCDFRILLHRPSNGALKYLTDSWAEALNFMGVETALLNWGQPTRETVESFCPDLLVTVCDQAYIDRLDWPFLTAVHRDKRLRIAQIAPNEHRFPPCDFFITWDLDPSRDPRFANFSEPLLAVPFGANPLTHYMRPGVELWDFFFVGTNSHLKSQTTRDYLQPILQEHEGILAGDHWPGGIGEMPVDRAALLYGFARIYPNYHLPTQYDRFDEINERTYIIPACGGFELVDRPLAITETFRPDEMAVASSPSEYREMFRLYLTHPDQREPIVRNGMRRVFAEYTLFHRLEGLLKYVGVAG